MFTDGFKKLAAPKVPKPSQLSAVGSEIGGHIKNFGQHLKKNRKDYMLGTAALGSVGTAYGANKRKK